MKTPKQATSLSMHKGNWNTPKSSQNLKTLFLLFSIVFFISKSSILIGQINWNPDRYFPHFTSADTIYEITVSCPIGFHSGAWAKDWRVYDTPEVMQGLSLVSMQGLINRSQARVFLKWQDPSGHFGDDLNGTWATEIAKQVTVVQLDLDHAGAMHFLLDKFADVFAGMVLYDPEVPETINLATMLAGLENRIIFAPQQVEEDPSLVFEDAIDLRLLVQEHKWDAGFESQLEIYQWVYDSLWPQLEHRIIGISSPGPPTSSDRETPDFYFPVDLAPRDYLIALKLTALYLNPKYPDHQALLHKFLADAPSPIPVTGAVAFNENGIVWSASRFGNFVSANTWPGETLSGGNLTVLSALRPPVKQIGSQINVDNILKTLSGRPVATLFISDGDALFFQTNRGFHNFFVWEEVQGQNFGWETNPLLHELAPTIWNYYQDTKAQVTFTSGISGIGYCTPHFMSKAQFSAYLQKGAPYFQEAGLRVLRFNGLEGPWDDRFAAQYYDHLKDYGYLGTIIGFRPSPPYGISLEYHGRPAPAAKPLLTLTPSNYKAVVRDLISRDPNEVNINFQKDPNIPEISQIKDEDAVDGQAIWIRRSYFNSQSYSLAFSSGPISLPPGQYTVRYRLKVSNKQSNGTIAIATLARQDTQYQQLARKEIRASDFARANTYQEFSFSFELDRLSHHLEFRLDYGDGSTDLHADQIVATNESPLALPVMAPIYLSLASDITEHAEMRTLAGDFAEAFEGRGGIVLTPDEFFAGLNPEYMLELATELLGDGHSGLDSARQQLEDGRFLASLLSSRAALQGSVTATKTLKGDHSRQVQLLPAYPNPFSKETAISFYLPEKQSVSIRIFDRQGRLINMLAKRVFPAGIQILNWNGETLNGLSVPQGLYFLQLNTESGTQGSRIVKW